MTLINKNVMLYIYSSNKVYTVFFTEENDKVYACIIRNDINYGINYVEQEESYTSMASFFDNDKLSVWTGEKQNVSFSGKRIKRGLYQIANGILINTDINGALNILRKSNLIDTRILQGIGCLAHPQRVWIN